MRNGCFLYWIGRGKGRDQCVDTGHLFLADLQSCMDYMDWMYLCFRNGVSKS